MQDNRRVDFDEVANSYQHLLNASLSLSGEEDGYFDFYKLTCLKHWLWDSDPGAMILDFGCGIGKLASLMAQAYPLSKIWGYDISNESISLARKRWRNLNNLFFKDGFSDLDAYDLITVANVFHHIARGERQMVLSRLQGLLNKKGVVLIFEHNPFNPLTRYVVRNCAFDVDAELISLGEFMRLAATCKLEVQQKHYIVFFPRFLRYFRKIEPFLRFIPIGAQYMLVLGSK